MEAATVAPILFDSILYITEVLFTVITFCIILFIFILRYQLIHSTKPVLISNHNRLRNKLSDYGFIIPLYKPTIWLTNGYAQTFFSALTHYGPTIQYEREMIDVKAIQPGRYDGVVALDWTHNYKKLPSSTPTVVILHGLTGGSFESYVRRIVHTLSNGCGYRVVVFNARGCGGTMLKSPQAFNAAYTDDLRQVVEYVHTKFPLSTMYAVGFSLGANILTKYLGEEGSRTPIKGALSVATPFNCIISDAHLHSTWFKRRVFSGRLASRLVRLFGGWLESDVFESISWLPDNMNDLPSMSSIREFDEYLTAKSFGYASLRGYYEDASSDRFVKDIRTPTLFVSSMDDPICAYHGIPFDSFVDNDNDHTMLLVTPCGGHSMDWFEKSFTFQPKSYLNRVAKLWFQALTQMHNNNNVNNVNAFTPASSSSLSVSSLSSSSPSPRVISKVTMNNNHHHHHQQQQQQQQEEEEELIIKERIRALEKQLDDYENQLSSSKHDVPLRQWDEYKEYMNELIGRCDSIELKYLTRLLDMTEELESCIKEIKEI